MCCQICSFVPRIPSAPSVRILASIWHSSIACSPVCCFRKRRKRSCVMICAIIWILTNGYPPCSHCPAASIRSLSKPGPFYSFTALLPLHPPLHRQQIPLCSHQSRTSSAETSLSSPIFPSPSVLSQTARSSSTMGSYIRIFSCQVGSL
jgi:hypothetical protein